MKLVIKEYKCLKDIELPLEGLVTVTGGYGSGKSTLVEALDHAFQAGEVSEAYIQDIEISRMPNLGVDSEIFLFWPEHIDDMCRSKYCRDLERPLIPSIINEIGKRRPDLVNLCHSLADGLPEEHLRTLTDRVSNRLMVTSQRRNALSDRLQAPESKLVGKTESELDKERNRLQASVNSLMKEIGEESRIAQNLAAQGNDPEIREKMLSAFSKIDDLKIAKAAARDGLRAISEEHARRRLLEDGADEDCKELEREIIKLESLMELLKDEKIREAPGNAMHGVFHDTQKNLDLLGLGEMTVASDGTVHIWNRPASELSSSERFKFGLAVAAAKMKSVGWPWLVIDWPCQGMAYLPSEFTTKIHEEFECVIWIETIIGQEITISQAMDTAAKA
jgi:ABC-type cobalamin/Fe3+-siderophores transport system ATPase subunit